MKKFLSILGVSILSVSLFVGCGGATEEDFNNALSDYMSTATKIGTQASSLSEDVQAKLMEDLASLQEEAQKYENISDDDYDTAIKAINELETKMKDIAKENGIEID